MKAEFFRQRVIQASFIAAAIILVLKVAQLQILDQSLKERADNVTLRKKTIYPFRGMIFDRNENLLVVNKPSYELDVTYNEIDPTMDTVKFCRLLDIDVDIFKSNLDKNWRSPRFNKAVPFKFLKQISPETFGRFQEHLHQFPGFEPVFRSIRSYPHNNAAHVLGYLGEVTTLDLDQNPTKYKLGDYKGKTGIEKQYDDQLRGSKGRSFVLRDNLGRDVGNLDDGRLDSLAVTGTDLISSLDLDLQQYGEYLFSNKRGSVVAIEPASGEILAMISAPNYDPNDLIISSKRGKVFSELINDTLDRPFFDRTLMAKYPPGSIFKPILALAALQENIITPLKRQTCNGSYEVNTKGFSQGCRNHPSPVTVRSALQHSCNSYFYQTLREYLNKEGYTKPGLGLNELKSYLKEFGIGTKLGIDNSHENSGFFPDAAYFDKIHNAQGWQWRAPAILSLGIGQGEIELTTLQMANLAAILANRGHYYTPHLIKSFKDENLEIPPRFRYKREVSIDKKHFDVVIDGLHDVVSYGTGYSAFVPGLDICGKTGTSQNYSGNRIDHSVFIAFAPKENPKIAIAVFVENAGGGSTVAAPLASLMIEKYLKGEISREYLETRIVEINLLNNT